MIGLRILPETNFSLAAPCARCEATGCPWDRIGEKSICPDCQEELAGGEGEPLVERLVQESCVVCRQMGTVRYMTFPLHSREPLAIDLCPAHFHAYLGRRLDRYAFRILERELKSLDLTPQQVFLLHEAFYDEDGHRLQPVI
ncbi:MAG: hypothetical protein ACKO23_07225 [Gemmataceae bacterium]